MKTHDNNDEVKPTPCVGEVLLKSVRAHFNNHLADEYHRKHFVHVLQNHLEYFPLRQIDVFNRLVTITVNNSVAEMNSSKMRRIIFPGDDSYY